MEQDLSKRQELEELTKRYEALQFEAEAEDLAPGEDVDYDDRVLALMGEMHEALREQAGLRD